MISDWVPISVLKSGNTNSKQACVPVGLYYTILHTSTSLSYCYKLNQMMSQILKAVVTFLLFSFSLSQSLENPHKITICASRSAGGAANQRSFLHPTRTKSTLALSSSQQTAQSSPLHIPRGGGYLPAGWNPFGYGVTDLGHEFLKFEGSRDSDVGRFLASLKSGRKKQNTLKEQWIEIVRVSKSGQSMRILRTLDDLIAFCLKAGFLD